MTMAALGITTDVSAQLGALVSPGRLSSPHAELEGLTNCLSCHTVGQGVSAAKCLSCHQPVAERTAQRTGVHRDVTTDCVTCHVEHAGVDGELRPFDQNGFDHTAGTRFPLDGVHTDVSCESCHKTRSFLAATTTCVSCHADVHTPTLGASCETCHTTTEPFAAAVTRFDHSRAAFQLTGAHTTVECASCHVNQTYKDVKFAACSDCHADPHATPMGAPCASCHTATTWRTTQVDHSRTAFPLIGDHAPVACVKCHAQPALQTTTKADTCATCHADPHDGVFDQDCASCHTESGFEKGTFDHSTTDFPLTDGHDGLTCAACHDTWTARIGQPAIRPASPAPARLALPIRPVTSSPRPGDILARSVQDFRGLDTACASCHEDVHRNELGAECEQCHSARTFEVATYTHAENRPFFDGEHRPVACVECHTSIRAPVRASITAPTGAPPVSLPESVLRVGFTRTTTTCVSCHEDVHLGQVGTGCETCHTVDGARFALVSFSHDQTTFPLTGEHAPLVCDACHKTETGVFPSEQGTAIRLTGIGTECVACHTDPHAGQLVVACETCHTVQTFSVSRYTHQNQRALRSFFAGRHLEAACVTCHETSTINGSATPVASYQTSTACVTCHEDEHRGALGPRCESCHRP